MEPKSKTKKKLEHKELQVLGKKLTALSKDQLSSIDMPEKLREAVLFAQTIRKHGALSRQIHYIGGIMRDVDTEPIRQAVENDAEARLAEVRLFRQAELWRDSLLTGDSELITEIIERFPGVDRQRLTLLIRNAKKEGLAGKAPKSSRALFRMLKDLLTAK